VATEAAWLNGKRKTKRECYSVLTWTGLLMEGGKSDRARQTERKERAFRAYTKVHCRAAKFLARRTDMRRRKLMWVTLAMLVSPPMWSGPTRHKLTVTLDYDFSSKHGCKPKGPIWCVEQFNIYELKGGARPVKLFSILAPSGAKKAVTGITGTSGWLTMSDGVHTFGATAEMGDGSESDPSACTATATVGTGELVSLSMTVR
jgi:hypothetical protein